MNFHGSLINNKDSEPDQERLVRMLIIEQMYDCLYNGYFIAQDGELNIEQMYDGCTTAVSLRRMAS
jgi:hypothetical protein